jgi:phosphohistidine phosphatase SixA
VSFVICVRHAEIDLPRDPNDADPALNAGGLLRAEALARWLAPAGVRRIYTSGAARTDQTVAPLARRLDLVPRRIAEVDALVAELRAQEGDGAACVAGHSDTIPRIIAALGADATGLRVDEADFASLFVVGGIGTPEARALRLVYGGAPP